MERYQALPVRYMSPENEVVRRFLIYHSPGTGKSFTALWIILNFINVYIKPCIILVKSKEAIEEFSKRVKAWYSYTFKYYPPLPNVEDYKQFIKKYIDFRTYITFCSSIKDIVDKNTDTDGNDNKSGYKQTTSNSFSFYDERLIIIDEVHHFRNNTKKKFIYNNLLLLLNHINKGRIIFMTATPIFDNANEITDLAKLIKPNLNSTSLLTPEKLKEVMLGHLSYYGLNPPNTSVNYIGSYMPGIQSYKIVKAPMQGVQLQNYRKVVKESQNNNNIGMNYMKATLGVLHLGNDDNLTQDTKKRSKLKDNSNLKKYELKNDNIIHSNPFLQDIIEQQSKDIKNYCCKLYHCLKEINRQESPDGLVFIYCSIIEEVGIYYFSAILCAMGFHYVHNLKSINSRHNEGASKNSNLKNKVNKKGKGVNHPLPHHFPSYHEVDDDDDNEFADLNEIRKERDSKFWNFTFITGDKQLCPNMMERLSLFNDPSNKDGSKIKVLLGSDIISESVDIMNVRQLHVLTPHWNYEKINQLIGRVRRVGSHDSLPPDQRSVNVYLYMAYDDEVECSDTKEYSTDYNKYIICEKKYKNALKYNQALQNASIESLVHAHSNANDSQTTNGLASKEQDKPFEVESSLSGRRAMSNTSIAMDANNHKEISKLKNINGNMLVCNTSIVPSSQYSSVYLDKVLPVYMIEINKMLKPFFSENNFIRIMDLMDRIPVINIFVLPKLIEYINSNNIVIAGGILRYSDGMIYRKISSNYHLNYKNAYFEKLLSHSLPIYNSYINKQINEQSSNFIHARVDIGGEEIVSLNNKLQDVDMSREAYNQIIRYSHTEVLFILRYAFHKKLANITKLFYLYWKQIDGFVYISYFSTIKNTSYASNKIKSVNDFSTNIIYADLTFQEWRLVNDEPDLRNISKLMEDHYYTEEAKRSQTRCKYVYMLCNDFTLRYRDFEANLNYSFKKQDRSTSASNSKNLREINRGRNITSFYVKQELMEMFIYSICYDDVESKLSSISIPGYTQTSVENMKEIFEEENNGDKYKELITHILSVVTRNDIQKYCKERPHQAFLLHELLKSFSVTISKTRKDIIDDWKKYLFNYDLIIIL